MVVHILVERERPSQAGRSCSLCLALAMMARLRTDGMMGFLLLAWHLQRFLVGFGLGTSKLRRLRPIGIQGLRAE